jgi:hypothetical protein
MSLDQSFEMAVELKDGKPGHWNIFPIPATESKLD